MFLPLRYVGLTDCRVTGRQPSPHSFRKIFHRVMSRGNLLSQPSSDTNRKGENTFIDHWPRESIHSPPVWAIKDLIYHDTICPDKITQDLKIDLKILNQLWLPITVCIIPDLMSSVSIVRSERSHQLIEKLQGLSLMFWSKHLFAFLEEKNSNNSETRRKWFDSVYRKKNKVLPTGTSESH